MTEQLKTGTTTLGVLCKDAVIIGADRRATSGSMIVGKTTQKVHRIADNIAVTIAGSVSDILLLIKLIRAELKLKQIRLGRPVTIQEAANLLASYVYSNIRNFSVIPGITHFIMAGSDVEGLHLYDIYPDGSVIEIDDFVSSGSGSVFVYGVLEANYKKEMSEKEGIDLAVRSIDAALQRDAGSGNGCDVWVVTKSGIRIAVEKALTQRLI